MVTATRYTACDCHLDDLADIPDKNIILLYGSCARRCVFCPSRFRDAPSVRRHGRKCPESSNILIKQQKHGQFTPYGEYKFCAEYLLTSRSGHKWWPSETQSNESTIGHALQSNPHITQLIWTPIHPFHKKIHLERSLVISFLPTISELEKKYPWFDGVDLDTIQTELGPAFVTSRKQQPDIHQGVVTMLLFKELSKCDVVLRKWDRFLRAVMDKSETEAMKLFRDANGQPLSTAILLSWTEEKSWLEDEMAQFYQRLERLRAYHGAIIHILPCYTEALQERAKLPDIRALDEIAAKKGQYRPKTCYPGELCCLQKEEKTVHKRQDSCGSDHVRLQMKAHRSSLTCFTTSSDPPTKLNAPLWFHQQFVDTFKQFGEFRAFIVAEPDPTGLRGRKGKIVCFAHTDWSTKDSAEIYIYAGNNRRLRDFHCKNLTQQSLDKFCLDTYEELRARPDWKEKWESLEIGGRLDVGVSPTPGNEEFWVVEPTRFHGADFFSEDILPEPKHILCEEFAKSISRYLSVKRQ